MADCSPAPTVSARRYRVAVNFPFAWPRGPDNVQVPWPVAVSNTICTFIPFGLANTPTDVPWASQIKTAVVSEPKVKVSRSHFTLNASGIGAASYQWASVVDAVPCHVSESGRGLGVGGGVGVGEGTGEGGGAGEGSGVGAGGVGTVGSGVTVCCAGSAAVVGAVGALPHADNVIVPNNSIEKTRMSRSSLLKGSMLTRCESSATCNRAPSVASATLEPSVG